MSCHLFGRFESKTGISARDKNCFPRKRDIGRQRFGSECELPVEETYHTPPFWLLFGLKAGEATGIDE